MPTATILFSVQHLKMQAQHSSDGEIALLSLVLKLTLPRPWSGNRALQGSLIRWSLIFPRTASALKALQSVAFSLTILRILLQSPHWPALLPPETPCSQFRCCLTRQLSLLAAFLDFCGPASPALLFSETLVRCNLQRSWTHLWRYLLPSIAQPHAGAIDELLMDLNSLQSRCHCH